MKSFNMKKMISFIVATAMICAVFAGGAVLSNRSNSAFADESSKVITLTIGSPVMMVDAEEMEIDPGRGTVPVIVSNRTLIPVRAVVEAMGGTVDWEEDTQNVTLSLGQHVITLTINSHTAYLNDEERALDAAPTIINERTMLPIRFIAEGFGCTVGWNNITQTVTITIPSVLPSETETSSAGDETASTVYMTTDISSEALMKIYDALDYDLSGNVGVKISTGEAGGHNFLDPNLIKDLVQEVDGTIVECNTAYGGSRSNTEVHLQTAKDHGFTEIADIDILDAEGSIALPVEGGKNLTEDYVGSHFTNYDSYLVLSHFKGHGMAGFGGALKNISIGFGSSEGKAWIHSGGTSRTSMWGGDQDAFIESMAEAAKAVDASMGDDILYINVMNKLSVDCDCSSNPKEPTMADIGILASKDPVALDKACVDLVYAATDGKDLIERMESRNGPYILDHAEAIGVGTKNYTIVSLD